MDEKIFKYMSSDVGKLVLNNKTIRFNSPLNFNDPYDAHPPYRFTNSHITTKEKNSLKTLFDKLANDTLILSLSTTNKDLMMWGHYANCHTGIVIEFYPNAKFLHGCTNVTYKKNTLRFDNNYEQYLASDCKVLKNALKQLFTTKYKTWEYEKEKRIIVDKTIKINSLKDYLSGTEINKLRSQSYIDLPFQTTDIKTIYFGCNIDENIQNELIQIVKTNYTHINKLYKAEKSPTEYKILFKELTINKKP